MQRVADRLRVGVDILHGFKLRSEHLPGQRIMLRQSGPFRLHRRVSPVIFHHHAHDAGLRNDGVDNPLYAPVALALKHLPGHARAVKGVNRA